MKLDSDQQAAVDAQAPRIKLDAGPGSGKTATLAARAARLIVEGLEPKSLVLLTYTRAMAGDLRRKVAAAMPDHTTCRVCLGSGQLGPFDCGACAGLGHQGIASLNVSTLHAFCARLVSEALAGELPGGESILATKWLTGADFEFVGDDDLDDYLRYTQRLVGGSKTITQQALREGLALRGEAVTKKDKAAELRLQLAARNLITYSDGLALAELVLRAGGVGERYPVLMLDERQDLTAQHWHLIGLWNPRELFAVGDPGQAIFGFLYGKDAVSWREALKAAAEAPLAEPVWDLSLELRPNYRSAPEIIDVLNDTRAALAADGACAPLVQTPMRPRTTAPIFERGRVASIWHPGQHQYHDDYIVAEAVTARVLEHIDSGRPLEDIAVLSATNDQLIACALDLQAVGVDCDLQHEALWMKSGIGRAVTAMARIACRGPDRMPLARLFRARGLEEGGVDAMYQRAFEEGVPVLQVLDRVIGPPGWWSTFSEAAVNMADIAALVADLPGGDRAATYIFSWMDEDRAALSPADWLRWAAAPTPTGPRKGVALRTIHGAKGLEWPVVILANASEGAIPPPWAREKTDQLEWGRALLVALSRAAEALVVIAPQFMRGQESPPCRWLRMQ